MKLLIEMPDSEYNDLKGLYLLGLETPAYKTFIEKTCVEAIANGTPLPEGHGRLIAEPTETDISNTVGGDNDFAECIRDSVKAVFDNATTIIEADMENSNGTGN